MYWTEARGQGALRKQPRRLKGLWFLTCMVCSAMGRADLKGPPGRERKRGTPSIFPSCRCRPAGRHRVFPVLGTVRTVGYSPAVSAIRHRATVADDQQRDFRGHDWRSLDRYLQGRRGIIHPPFLPRGDLLDLYQRVFE